MDHKKDYIHTIQGCMHQYMMHQTIMKLYNQLATMFGIQCYAMPGSYHMIQHLICHVGCKSIPHDHVVYLLTTWYSF